MNTTLNLTESQLKLASTSLLPLLHQVQRALQCLIDNDEPTSIDLCCQSLLPAQEQCLLDFLGKGEVEARLNVFGESILQETRYTGVWLVEHYNPDAELTGRYLEIAWLPNILSSPVEDVHNAFEKLTCHLDELK